MKSFFTVLLAGVALLTSCTSVQNIYFEVNDQADFTNYRTFAWLPKDSTTINNVLYDNQMVQKKLQNSVSSELENRGLGYNSSTPDLLLQYTIIVDKKQRLMSYPVYSYTPVSPHAFFYPYYPAYPYDQTYSINYQSQLRNSLSTVDPYIIPRPNMPNLPFYNPNYMSNAYPWNEVMVGSNFQQIEFEEGTVVIDAIDRRTGELLWRGWSVGNFSNAEIFKDEVDNVIDYIFDKFPVKEKKKGLEGLNDPR